MCRQTDPEANLWAAVAKREALLRLCRMKNEGEPMSMLWSASSLLTLFAVTVPAMAQELEEALTLAKSRLRPVHFNGGV